MSKVWPPQAASSLLPCDNMTPRGTIHMSSRGRKGQRCACSFSPHLFPLQISPTLLPGRSFGAPKLILGYLVWKPPGAPSLLARECLTSHHAPYSSCSERVPFLREPPRSSADICCLLPRFLPSKCWYIPTSQLGRQLTMKPSLALSGSTNLPFGFYSLCTCLFNSPFHVVLKIIFFMSRTPDLELCTWHPVSPSEWWLIWSITKRGLASFCFSWCPL